MADLVGEVAALIEEAAAREIMPRFRLLAAGEIEEKSKGDFVTVADRAAELWLTPRLEALVAGSRVLGEEAAAADPRLMDLVHGDAPVWTVDPVDGTANFIAGRETFGVMVALVEGGETLRAWIYLPVTGDMALAERGGGAWWRTRATTERMRAGTSPTSLAEITAAINVRFMPDEWRALIEAFAARVGHGANDMCSAVDYTALARGRKDFITYHRMMPWDHVPGALILREAGGVVRDMGTGRDYGPRVLAGPHLVARDAESWGRIAEAIRAG